MTLIRIQHGRTTLALHPLQDGEGPTLLALHGLGEQTLQWTEDLTHWPGPVFGLDFSGHGASDAVRGGAYSCEMFAADADCALARCGAVAVVGRGVGAYVALLLSGARPQQIRASLLVPGPGLTGGAALPRFDVLPPLIEDEATAGSTTDPLVFILDRDVRPVDYATVFATNANSLLVVEDGSARPPWWEAVRALPHSTFVSGGVRDGLSALAHAISDGDSASRRAAH